MMKAFYSPVMQAWVVLFGHRIDTASVIDIDGTRHWNSKRELRECLESKGLHLDSNNRISVVNEDGDIRPCDQNEV